MPSQELDYDAIRKRAEKRVKDRVGFLVHLAVFVTVNLFLWGLGIITGSLAFPWPLLVTLGWGIGLVSHGVVVYLDSGPMDKMRDQAIRREIELEKQRLGISDAGGDDDELAVQKTKRKNSERAVRLGDDGELIDIDQADAAEQDRNFRSLN